MTVRLGYVGLGSMGGAMVERACGAGLAPEVYDLDSSRVDAAVALGARPAPDVATLARDCDVVSVCVPAAGHVEAVLEGPDGVYAGAQTRPAGASRPVVLVHSTVSGGDVEAWNREALSRGVAVHDAAVAGGADAARRGQLVVFVGGLSALPADARRVLETYADLVVDAGRVGGGAVLKLGVNLMTYAQQAAAAAAWDLVSGWGGDPRLLLDAWRHIGQLGRLTERYAGLLPIGVEAVDGDLARMLAATAAIAHKDLRLAGEALSHHRWDALVTAVDAAVERTLRLEP